jgi:hypothetical protein
MNPLPGPRQQQQKQQQKQKNLRIKNMRITLEFHSRLIEAAEVRFCETHRFAVSPEVLRHPLKALMDPRAAWHG